MSKAKSKKIDVSVLDGLIVGRVEPQIYAFSTETVPNYLKVGDTYRPLEKRLNEWREYYPDLEKKFDDVAKVDEETFFRDHAVHLFLESEAQKERLTPEKNKASHYSKEFFKDTDKNDVANAIEDIKKSFKYKENKYQYYKFEDSLIPQTYTYERTEDYSPRPNQKETIKRFKSAVEKGRTNLLMYAVMRFGKSFTSLCCAVEIKANIVLVVSAKADVKEEWKRTVESHKKFKDYVFLDSDTLMQSDEAISNKRADNKKIVLFLTLQDLQGEEIKTKHKEVFENEIDLLIVDETHFGARASEYGRVLREETALTSTQIKKEGELNDNTLEEVEEIVKTLKSKIRLHLSGTPYRILMGSEFEEGDVVAFYQFSNIAEDQERWDKENLNKDGISEWENPYYGFPQMVRFAFNPNEATRKKMEELREIGVTYAFSEFLRPKSIAKDTENSLHKKFKHEKEVLELLSVIDGSKQDDNLLGFLDYEKLKNGKMCRHLVCVLPYRASCDALEALIRSKKFKNLSEYEVINISGVDSGKHYKDTQAVKTKIKNCEAKGIKTITLTVNRMLTGSTVPEWDTMLFFKDTASPQEYDQAIFRLQNQYIRTYKEADGDVVKFNMKPQTLLVDFNPNRMFLMQEHKAQIYNVNTESNGNSRLEERIRRELEISPIVVVNNKKISQIKPSDILDAVRQYSSERSVVDEATSISVDMSLLDFEEIRAELDKQNKIGSRDGLEIKSAEGEGDEMDVDDASEETSNENERPETSVIDENEEDSYKDKFAMYYARILFFALLTDSRVKSLEEVISIIDKGKDNKRIAKNIDLRKDILKLLQENINPFVLSELDYKIQNINYLANDPALEPIERASNALKKFSRLSDSEIVTPVETAGKIIDTFPKNAINSSTKILDIASKQGEFLYGVYKKFGRTVARNFYSIPTSKIAYEFTRKVYKLLELDVNLVESNYNSYDLIENENLTVGNSVKINSNNMNFDVIIGNPPYQKTISSNSKNKSLSKQIFPEFIRLSVRLNPKYLSLVTPSRWFTGDAQDKSFLKLRNFFRENNHIQSIVNIPISKNVFPDVEISGGVNYFLYNPKHQGDVEFTEFYDEQNKTTKKRPLFEEGLDIILNSSYSYKIIQKVSSQKDFESLTTITKGRNAFGVLGKDANQISFANKKAGYYELRCKYEEIRYIDPKFVTKNVDLVKKWKIFISKGNGAAGLLSDGKKVSILGLPYLGGPKSVCTDSLIPIGCFDTKSEAQALSLYIKTKFFRYLVGTLKTSQNVLQNVYKFVPLQDFTSESDIDWKKSIDEIDEQLYARYGLTKKEAAFIDDIIKPMS